MKQRTYTYTEAQVEAMDSYNIREAAIQLFTQIAILWDENDRPKRWQFTYADLDGLFHGTLRTAMADCLVLKHAGLIGSNLSGRYHKLHLTEEGMMVASRILQCKGRKFRRLYVSPVPGRGNQKFFHTRWHESMRRYSQHIYAIPIERYANENTRTFYFADIKHIEQIQESMHGHIKTRIPLPDRLRKLNAPKMLIDKVGIFGEHNLPNWLRYDVEQFIGEKLAI